MMVYADTLRPVPNFPALDTGEAANINAYVPSDDVPKHEFVKIGTCACGDDVDYFISWDKGMYLHFKPDAYKVELMAGELDDAFDCVTFIDIGPYRRELDGLLKAFAAYDSVEVPEFSDVFGFPEFADTYETEMHKENISDRMDQICRRMLLSFAPGRIGHA